MRKAEYHIKDAYGIDPLIQLLHTYYNVNKGKRTFVVTIQENKKLHTQDQRGYMHAGIVQAVVKAFEENPRWAIEGNMKATDFEIDKEWVWWWIKRMFNEGKSTKNHDTEEFNELIDKVKHYFFHEHQFHLPEPTTNQGE